MKKIDKGFNLKCLNCNSTNINIDFENNVFWCEDCTNTSDCLDFGKEIDNIKRI